MDAGQRPIHPLVTQEMHNKENMMTNKITVDARGAGQGKTTDPKDGIYSRIQRYNLTGERALITAPSKDLQEQYRKDLLAKGITITVVNEDTVFEGQSVSRQYNECLGEHQFICITSQTFKNSKHRDRDYHLILDECIAPFKPFTVKFKPNPAWSVAMPFNLSALFEVTDRWKDYICIRPIWTKEMQDNEYIRRFISEFDDTTNHSMWVKSSDYKRFAENAGELTIINVLDKSHFQGWKSVHIAAAAFDYSLTSQLLKFHNIEYKIERPFVKHTNKVVIHTSEEKFSKNRYQTKKSEVDEFIKYTESIAGNNFIGLANNNVDMISEKVVQFSHNSHGLNHAKDKHTALVLSVINVPTAYADFINKITEDQFTAKLATETYGIYQFVMRTSLRVQGSKETVNIVIPCTYSSLLLSEYFFSDYTQVNIKKELYSEKVITLRDQIIDLASKLGQDTFVDIPGYEDIYQMNAQGVLRRFLKTGKSKDKQLNLEIGTGETIALSKDNTKTRYTPHLLYRQVFGEFLKEK